MLTDEKLAELRRISKAYSARKHPEWDESKFVLDVLPALLTELEAARKVVAAAENQHDHTCGCSICTARRRALDAALAAYKEATK